MLTFDNIDYYTGSLNEFTEYIFRKEKKFSYSKKIITHINLKNFYYLNKNPELKNWIKNNCITVFEGIGLKAGFFLKGYGLIKDLNGTDLFPFFMKKIKASGKSVYLLGAEEKYIQKTAENINKNYPGIKISGFHNGYFSQAEEDEIINKINNSKTDILIIGMGFPEQENFIMRNSGKVNVSTIWFVGGLFDFISGNKPRSPYILRRLRLEWLFRFFLEPRRMLHRNTICAFGAFKYLLTNN